MAGTNDPAAWDGGEYWGNVEDGGTSNSWVKELIGSNTKVIPADGPSAGGRAHLRIETYIDYDVAGSADFATLSTRTGPEYKVRSIYNSKSAVADCTAAVDGRTNMQFSGDITAWHTLSNGFGVTRRYINTPTNMGVRGTPNPNVGSNATLWRQAS